MVIQAYPPHAPVSSKPLSLNAARELIASYLKSSETTEYRHPDALLCTSGIQYATAGGSQGGIVLHNLRRVEAGLRGEVLKVEPEEDEMELDGMMEETEKLQAEGDALKKGNKTLRSGEAEQDWQEMEDYQQEQQKAGEEFGEIGTRTNFVADGGEIPEVTATEADGTPKKGKVDKEARKKAKKERERQQKLEREAKRKREA